MSTNSRSRTCSSFGGPHRPALSLKDTDPPLPSVVDAHGPPPTPTAWPEKITRGLSNLEKMPWMARGISALRCRIGLVLAQQKDTVCNPEVCYARNRNCRRETVQAHLGQR